MKYTELDLEKLAEHFNPIEFDNANEMFETLYCLLNYAGEEYAPRGLNVRERRDISFIIKNPMDNLVYNKFRQASPRYLAAENLWYLSGDDNASSIVKYAPFWGTIADEDGKVNSNYGKYLFKTLDENGKSQFDKLYDLLSSDKDTRKALYVQPICGDVANGVKDTRYTKDTICTASYQFQIRNNKLELTVYMRSNDLINGTCNDIFFFTTLQIMMAQRLGIELGNYRHVTGNIHIYEKDWVENKLDNEFELDETEFKYKYPESVKDYDYEHDLKELMSENFDKFDYSKMDITNDRFLYMLENKYKKK